MSGNSIFSEPRWLTGRLTRLGPAERIRLHAAVFGVSLLWLFIVFVAASLDGTLTLSGHGRGFLQHRGYTAVHLATPVALSLSLLALDTFSRLMGRLQDFVVPGHDIQDLEKCRDEHLAIVNLKSRWTWLLLLFITCGAMCSIVIFSQVIEPGKTYGNDVFNALHYPLGYYTANIYLAISWSVVFPLSLFLVLQITAAIVVILGRARQRGSLFVDLLHTDNCGGLSPFGNLNLLLMLYYVPPFLAMLALAATHSQRYASLLIPAVVLSLVFLAQSSIGVYAIRLAIQAEKSKRLESLHDELKQALYQPLNRAGQEVTFLLWQHVRGVKTMPYAAKAHIFVEVLRYVPPFIAVLNILRAE